jgi:hypothetical protein
MISGVPYNQRRVLLHFNTKVALVNLITKMWLSAFSQDFFPCFKRMANPAYQPHKEAEELTSEAARSVRLDGPKPEKVNISDHAASYTVRWPRPITRP